MPARVKLSAPALGTKRPFRTRCGFGKVILPPGTLQAQTLRLRRSYQKLLLHADARSNATRQSTTQAEEPAGAKAPG